MSRLSPDAANGILSYFTRHKTMANLLLVILIVAGLLALPKMRSQFFPDIIIDNINISVVWQGAGAEDVDSAIVRVLEPVLLGVDGVSGASSTSNEGRARISLEFEPSWDMGRAKGMLKRRWIVSLPFHKIVKIPLLSEAGGAIA